MDLAPPELSVAAQPYPFAFPPATTALVVIDMQRDFIEDGGFGAALGNDVSRLRAIVPTVAALLELFRTHAGRVIHTRECHRADLSDCPPSKRKRGRSPLRIGDPGPMGRLLIGGEPGAAIIADCAPRPGEWVIDKPGKGMFWATGLHERLQSAGITHLVFSGVTTEVCVQTSMREANDRGYDCLLIEDATESYFAEFKASTLAMIAAQGGIVGWTAPFAALAKAFDPSGVSRPKREIGQRMTPDTDDCGATIAYIEASAHLLGLRIAPQWIAGVRANLEVSLRLARVVAQFSFPDDIEPAPIFEA